MARILARLGFPQSVGAYCDGRSVYLCHVVATPFLVTQRARSVAAPEAETESDRLAHALDGLGTAGAGLRVVLGVPTERCYLATRPVSSPGGVASPKVLLRESLRSGSVSVDQMVADCVASCPDRREVASIAACDRGLIAPVHDALEERHMRLVRAEPAPCALLRLAQKRDRLSRKNRLVVRVFLNETQALALLTARGRPIVWRSARLPKGDEAAAMVALVRSLVTVAKPSGVEPQPDAVVAHGRMDLGRLVDADWIRQQLGVPFRWLDSPALDGSQIAYGLALAGLEDTAEGFDLAKGFHGQPTLREIFPWRDVILYAAILLVMAGFLWYRRLQLEDAFAAAGGRGGQTVAVSAATSDLEHEKKNLQARVSAVQRFLGSRVIWTNCLRELSSALPDNVYLTSINGDAVLAGPKKGKAAGKRALVIKGAASLPDSGLIPHEIDSLFTVIRNHPVITKDFPVIELADLKQFRGVEGDGELAMFTFVCLPKGNGNKR